MLKVNLIDSLQRVSNYIYGQNFEQQYVDIEIGDIVSHVTSLMSDDYKMSKTNLPTEYKVLKTACRDWYENGKVRTQYEVT